MIERIAGDQITFETMHDAYEEVDKEKRKRQVLSILTHPMTASEVAAEMFNQGYVKMFDRNNAAPRLTELAKEGKVDTIGKKRCQYTGKTVTVYRRV